ncbi:uncharacterized protein LOC117318295 isoform X1 [Pecten maximus]|uniref:uncharacterized protein LOC117318295 isoform X1 n=1 Tax=Pecten maximus TaxID=6579 RepID=UPI001458A6E4|nr:uncharacterized protein LOC117318295 isoform X1 [Pecten maximus]XP_033729183.1 uncharacterized protein LOC117318295 isoform X1 [Pecten maximus]
MGHRRGNVQDHYNFPVEHLSIEALENQMLHIFRQQSNTFKVNLSFGFALTDIEGSMRYFYPHNNETVLDQPMLISELRDVRRLIDRLRETDLLATVFSQRPSTKWRVYRVTNVRWTVTRTSFPLGAQVTLPDFIKNLNSVINLTHDRNTGRPFTDNLCIFRCLAYDRVRDTKNIERTTHKLFRDYTEDKFSSETYPGTPLSEIGNIEKHFSVNINVYRLSETGDVTFVWRSTERYQHTISLNQFENHLSFIKSLSVYSKKYRCRSCDKMFTSAYSLRRHEKTCENATKFVFPGGYHSIIPTIHENLESFGFTVENDDRFYSYFITFDFESMLRRSDTYLHEHIPVSCSVCSNVPGYESPHCIVDENSPDALVEKFVNYLTEIQCMAAERTRERFNDILERMDEEIVDSDDVGDDDDDETPTDRHRHNQLFKLRDDLNRYIDQIPVIGFNSAKYDINLIKTKLVKHLNLMEDKASFVVKKCNQYMCISSERFRFIDISNFLAAGSSYDQFIKAYHPGEMRKGYFCYEFLDSPEKLNYPRLPPYDSFYTELKQCNVLEEELNAYNALLIDGFNHSEACKQMNIHQKPLSGEEKYEELELVWAREKMSTFRDYLIYYNNLDVEPFRDAVQRLLDYYIGDGVDVFKTCISVPGVARQLLFRSMEGTAHFALFRDEDRDIHEKIQRGIVGGPSTVFRRYHEKGVTRIRDGDKTCECFLGLDANALYLDSISKPMPTGYYAVRREETRFALERKDKYLKAIKWLDFVAVSENRDIQHVLNRGREHRIGPYRVDGFDSGTNTVFEFDGCYYHSHHCIKNLDPELRKKREARSEKRERYIKERGYNIRRIWECEFDKMARINDRLREHCETYKRETERLKHMTMDQILDFVRAEKLFGTIEVDLAVPPHMKDIFSEMSPIFANAHVPYECIGEYTQDIGERIGVSKKPRRLLIGGMSARNILIATPLLKWYLEHGLTVSRVHTVIEYQPRACFKTFTEEISDARRAGDRDPSLAIVAETCKLKGNASYGSMLMRKDRHSNIKYLNSEDKLFQAVNDKHFRKLVELGDGQYEIETAKTRVKMDIPIQIGFFILQYAKLRMLSFYYDCLDLYWDRRDFELIAMDTDSYYLALSGTDLEALVRSNMTAEFETVKYDWFPDDRTPESKAHTRRTPGLMKEEMRGDVMVSLCSKSYCVQQISASGKKSSKISCKGINKRQLRHPIELYKDVLFNKEVRSKVNRGFRVINNQIVTYTQEKCGFTSFYPKRKVLEDGIRTEPLDLVL